MLARNSDERHSEKISDSTGKAFERSALFALARTCQAAMQTATAAISTDTTLMTSLSMQATSKSSYDSQRASYLGMTKQLIDSLISMYQFAAFFIVIPS